MQRGGDTETHRGGHRKAQGRRDTETHWGDTETHRGEPRNAQGGDTETHKCDSLTDSLTDSQKDVHIEVVPT